LFQNYEIGTGNWDWTTGRTTEELWFDSW